MTYQPPAGPPPGAGPPGWSGVAPPQTYLVWSILNLIFCCLPFGIVALVFSIQCQSAITGGREYEANDFSGKARGWNIAATAVGVAAVLIGIIIFAIGAATAHHIANQGNTNYP